MSNDKDATNPCGGGNVISLLVIVMAEDTEESMQVDDGKQGDREAHSNIFVNAGALSKLGHRGDSAHNERKINDSISKSSKNVRKESVRSSRPEVAVFEVALVAVVVVVLLPMAVVKRVVVLVRILEAISKGSGGSRYNTDDNSKGHAARESQAWLNVFKGREIGTRMQK